MKVHRQQLGSTLGHGAQPATPVHAIRLSNERGAAATVWTYGATLVEMLVPDRGGQAENVVRRLPDLCSYEDRQTNPSYMGAVMGRYARCVAHGRFALDGIAYQLDRNLGDHHFHGGSLGFDRFVWEAETEISADSASLHLYLERPEGDQGYPGAVAVRTTYQLLENGDLVISHGATATRSTIVALSSHAYWNLAGAGRIDGHHLTLNARRVVATDAEFIPSGPFLATGGTGLDWTAGREVGAQKLDHCFVLDDAAWAARLRDPQSGRTMDIVTDQPGLAVYSADMLRPQRCGLCLQTGALPDSPNRPDFPSSRLDPGALYAHHTTYRFSLT